GPGYYIEDAGYPIGIDWLLEGTTAPRLAGRLGRLVIRRLCARVTGNPRSDISAEIGRLLGGAERSSSSLPLLGMGRDTPDGTMRLRRGQLDVKWSMKTSAEFFSRVDATMAAIAGQLDADFHRNPLWRFKRAVTVHPLGGAPMGREESSGVVDVDGEVFNHPGLFVADGSVMPGPVGANPSLTIAAFADRMAVRMLEGRNRPVTTSSRPSANQSPPPPTALEFTEEMKGFVTFGQLDYQEGFRQGRESGESLMFHLTMKMDDVERFLADPQHACRVVGYVDIPRLGRQRRVEDGEFNLFVESDGPEATQMRYRLLFSDGDGAPLTLQGLKTIRDDPGFDVWSDTTTLYTRILEGHVPPGADAEVRAAGILRIHMRDFLRQLTTFRAHGPTLAAEAKAVAAFGRLFVGELWDIYHESAHRVGDRS
ncbi:MAG: GMC family oxidoreductase, partial [Acidimicrobiia bacterium]